MEKERAAHRRQGRPAVEGETVLGPVDLLVLQPPEDPALPREAVQGSAQDRVVAALTEANGASQHFSKLTASSQL